MLPCPRCSLLLALRPHLLAAALWRPHCETPTRLVRLRVLRFPLRPGSALFSLVRLLSGLFLASCPPLGMRVPLHASMSPPPSGANDARQRRQLKGFYLGPAPGHMAALSRPSWPCWLALASVYTGGLCWPLPFGHRRRRRSIGRRCAFLGDKQVPFFRSSSRPLPHLRSAQAGRGVVWQFSCSCRSLACPLLCNLLSVVPASLLLFGPVGSSWVPM